MDKKITIYDIAEMAGVSPATVSRVLTGNVRVSSAKKEKILELIRKYNFQPNASARSLISKETKIIGFILPDITHPFFSTVFLGAEKQALRLGYTLILCNSMNDNAFNVTNMESLYLKVLLEKQVDGIIFMGGRINDIYANRDYTAEMNEILRNVPIVMINGKMKDVDCCIVRTDEKAGIQNLVKYLAGLGHRKIGFIGGSKGISSSDEKLRTLKREAGKYNLICRKEWIIPSSFSIDDGYESMEKMLENDELPTAVMAVNDFVAIGAMRAAEEHGLNIPRDISITGFDGIELANLVRPRITTVSQNCLTLGATAVDVIVGLLKGEKSKKETVVRTELLVKESCRAI